MFATLIIYCKFQPLVFNTFWEIEFSIFTPYKCIGTRIWTCRKKVKCQPRVIIHTNLDDLVSSQCSVTRFSLEAFLVLAKKIFKCFLPYMGMVVIFFNTTEGPMWNLVKIGLSVSEKKTFKDYKILYMYIAQRQGQITPGDKILIVTERVCYFDHTL